MPQAKLSQFFQTILAGRPALKASEAKDNTKWDQPKAPQGLLPRKTAWMAPNVTVSSMSSCSGEAWLQMSLPIRWRLGRKPLEDADSGAVFIAHACSEVIRSPKYGALESLEALHHRNGHAKASSSSPSPSRPGWTSCSAPT